MRMPDKNTVRVPEISARYFEVYRHWVYNSKLNCTTLGCSTVGLGSRKVTEAEKESSSSYAHHFMRFWVIAEFLRDTGLQNTITDELVKWRIAPNFPVSIYPHTLAFVDKNTSLDCPLRQFCIDWANGSGKRTFTMRLISGKVKVAELPEWLTYGVLVFEKPNMLECQSVDTLKLKYHVHPMDEA